MSSLLEQAEAIESFILTFKDSLTAHHLSEAMTCSEVEVLATLLLTHGEEEAANRWISVHEETDDSDGWHYEEEKEPECPVLSA